LQQTHRFTARQIKWEPTTVNITQRSAESQIPSDVSLLTRIENWRMVFRTAQIMHAVPFYTPPDGHTPVDPPEARIPPYIQDAALLEDTWRCMQDVAVKQFIKLYYIQRATLQVIRRKMRKHGVILRTPEDQSNFNNNALRQFAHALKVLP
jgi:hypothetical protein